jgi:hypothetical protein
VLIITAVATLILLQADKSIVQASRSIGNGLLACEVKLAFVIIDIRTVEEASKGERD